MEREPAAHRSFRHPARRRREGVRGGSRRSPPRLGLRARAVQPALACVGHGAARRARSSAPTTTCSSGTTGCTRVSRPRRSAPRSPDWSVWTHEVVGGESVDQVGARADRVIERAVARRRRRRARRPRPLPADPRRSMDRAAARPGPATSRSTPASMSVLGWERETRVIRHWNIRQRPQSRAEPR